MEASLQGTWDGKNIVNLAIHLLERTPNSRTTETFFKMRTLTWKVFTST